MNSNIIKEAKDLINTFKSDTLAIKHVELLINAINDSVKYVKLTRENHQIIDNQRDYWTNVIKEIIKNGRNKNN